MPSRQSYSHKNKQNVVIKLLYMQTPQQITHFLKVHRRITFKTMQADRQKTFFIFEDTVVVTVPLFADAHI